MAEHGVMLVQYRKAMRDIQRGSGRESFLPKGILCPFFMRPSKPAYLLPQIRQLDSLPGVDTTAARAILAEIGIDMSRFGADARLAAWAGVCPGNNESAGKRWRGRARKGNRSLRRVLVQWAWAARKTPTYLGRTFRRLEARLGGKKAAVAVAHKILVIVYHLLAEGTMYEETRYDHLQSSQEAYQRKRAVKALERLGYQVPLARVA